MTEQLDKNKVIDQIADDMVQDLLNEEHQGAADWADQVLPKFKEAIDAFHDHGTVFDQLEAEWSKIYQEVIREAIRRSPSKMPDEFAFANRDEAVNQIASEIVSLIFNDQGQDNLQDANVWADQVVGVEEEWPTDLNDEDFHELLDKHTEEHNRLIEDAFARVAVIVARGRR